MIKHIYNEEGLVGFFKGIVPSLLLTLNPIIQFTIYESMKTYFTTAKGEVSNNTIAISSMTSKLISTIVNYPLISIKTLYQARTKDDTNLSMPDLISKIINNEGILGLFKGNLLN